MLQDVVEVHHVAGYRLRLRFANGVEGEVDLERSLVFRGVFAGLRDLSGFGRVRVEPELGTVVWPNGANLDPDVLYAWATGQHQHLLPEVSNSA